MLSILHICTSVSICIYSSPVFLFPPQMNRASRNLWITFFILKDFWETVKNRAECYLWIKKKKKSWNISAAQNKLHKPEWITDDSITAERWWEIRCKKWLVFHTVICFQIEYSSRVWWQAGYVRSDGKCYKSLCLFWQHQGQLICIEIQSFTREDLKK